MSIQNALEKLDEYNGDNQFKEFLRSILLAMKDDTDWQAELSQRTTKLMFQIESIEKRIGELLRFVQKSDNWNISLQKRIEEIERKTACWTDDLNQLDACCRQRHLMVDAVSIDPMDCTDESDPQSDNCDKPSSPSKTEQTLEDKIVDISKVEEFVTKQSMEFFNLFNDDVKTKPDKFIHVQEKIRMILHGKGYSGSIHSHQDPSKVSIDRKVAEEWLKFKGEPFSRRCVKPVADLYNALKQSLNK